MGEPLVYFLFNLSLIMYEGYITIYSYYLTVCYLLMLVVSMIMNGIMHGHVLLDGVTIPTDNTKERV